MESYLYMLLGVLTVLILAIVLIFTGVMLFEDDLVLKHRSNHKHRFLH